MNTDKSIEVLNIFIESYKTVSRATEKHGVKHFFLNFNKPVKNCRLKLIKEIKKIGKKSILRTKINGFYLNFGLI